MNTEVMCRICLKSEFTEGIHLDDRINAFTVSEVIVSITSVRFQMEDGFPQRVCYDCVADLKNAIEFKKRCEKADLTIRKLQVESSHVKLENDECYQINDNFSVKSEEHDILDQCTEYNNQDSLPKVECNVNENKCDSSLICKACNKPFADKHTYNKHFKSHKHTFTCDVCKKSFLKYSSLEKHVISKHSEPGLIDGKLLDQDSVEVLGEGKLRVFKCKSCEYRTKRMVHMRAHIVIHTGVKPFRCKMCPKAYTQLGSLQFHIEKVHMNKNLSVPCEVCGKMLSSKKHLWTHLKTHSDCIHLCSVCNVQLKNEKTLAQHMSRHSGHKNYSCEFCAAAFYTFSELCNHKNKHKGEESMFVCKYCNYKVKRKSLLKTHMEKHSPNLPHTCQLCGRMFSSLQAMKVHKKRHAEWKLYKCPLCITRFSNVRTLKSHLMKIHNESWSVNCWKAVKRTLKNDVSQKIHEIPVS